MKTRAKQKQIRILLADDHSVVREGLAALITRQPDMRVIGNVSSGTEAVAKFLELRPDVGLFDVRMNGADGIESLEAIQLHNPGARIVFLSAFCNEEDVHRGFSAGARAYLVKESSPQELFECIRRVASGLTYIPPYVASMLASRVRRHSLSPREQEVLRLVALGKSNKEIAVALTIAEGTVKVHVDHILKKLGAHGRVEAAALGLQLGLVRLNDTEL